MRKIIFSIKVLGVIIVLGFIILFFNYVTNPYNEKADRVSQGLYSTDKIFQDIDVALIGGSHGANGFNPHEIYKNYGLTAYNFSLSGEPIYVNYYYLKELYKTRKPTLVVLDLYYLGMVNDTFSRDEYVFDIIRCFHYNKNRLDLIMNGTNKRQRALFPILQYHSRWNELTAKDLWRENDTTNDYLLGSQYFFEPDSEEKFSFNPWNNTKASGGITEKNKKYLQMIIDLVRGEGSEIMFVDLPHNHDDSGAPDTWTTNEYAIFNEAAAIAQKNKVKFLQYNDNVLKEIGFVPEEDMQNKGHMNYYGSVKASNYLGQYLIDNYEFDMDVKEKETWDGYMEKYDALVNESS